MEIVVVLSGRETNNRARLGLSIAEEKGIKYVVFSGVEPGYFAYSELTDKIERFCKKHDITPIYETCSKTTKENAQNVYAGLKTTFDGLERIHVITQATHIPRAKMVFSELEKKLQTKIEFHGCLNHGWKREIIVGMKEVAGWAYYKLQDYLPKKGIFKKIVEKVKEL